VDAQLLLAGCQAAGPAAVPWVAALALLLGDSQPLLGAPLPLPSVDPACTRFYAQPWAMHQHHCDASVALPMSLSCAAMTA